MPQAINPPELTIDQADAPANIGTNFDLRIWPIDPFHYPRRPLRRIQAANNLCRIEQHRIQACIGRVAVAVISDVG